MSLADLLNIEMCDILLLFQCSFPPTFSPIQDTKEYINYVKNKTPFFIL